MKSAVIVNFVIFVFCASGINGNYSKNDTSLRFFVLGDWGGVPFYPYKTFIELGVAYQMGKQAENKSIDFIMALGDNFYLSGVTDVSDPRFQETFENVFVSKSLYCPWYVVAGNHDHYGNASAQIEYSKLSKRWNFPDYYYKNTFKIPSSNATLDIIMIDTVLLCGNTDPLDERGQPLEEELDKLLSKKQLAWIEDNLKSSKATYLFVCGHFPMYSIAEHGSTNCLIEKLLPLLQKYKVTAYLSGHDHNLQHIRPSNVSWSLDYFVIGSSNYIDPSKEHIGTIPTGSLKYTWANLLSFGAFAQFEATPEYIKMNFIEANGSILYEYSMKSRK